MKISFSSLHPFVNFLLYRGDDTMYDVSSSSFLIGAILLIVIINVMQGNSEKIRKDVTEHNRFLLWSFYLIRYSRIEVELHYFG